MTVEEQILNCIKIQSRLKGVDSEIGKINVGISGFQSALSDAEKSKEDLLEQKKVAEDNLSIASKDVEGARVGVSVAQSKLREAQKIESKLDEIFESFTDEKFAEADSKIDEVEANISAAETRMNKALKEKDSLVNELKKLQADLRKDGYFLDFEQPSQPTTTYL